jgi:hypothetical protein
MRTDLVDGNDIRVLQIRRGFRFRIKTFDGRLVG